MKSKMKIFLAGGLVGFGFLLGLPKQAQTVFGNYGGGSGSENDPYLISTPQHLKEFNYDIMVNGLDTTGKYYRLTADIDFSNYDTDGDPSNGNWTPIGTRATPFSGVFDGQGHIISNLSVLLPSQSYSGFFGYTTNAVIQNLALNDISVSGSGYIGGLIGYQSGGSVSQVKVSGEVIGTSSYLGGLIGYLDNGSVSQSYSLASVTGGGKTHYVGGLVGYWKSGSISESYSTGSVTRAVNSNSGGLIGQRGSSSLTPSNSYWDVETSGKTSSYGGVGLTTDQMIGEIGLKSFVGFDFDDVWRLNKKFYPSFRWESEIIETEAELSVMGQIQPSIISITVPTTSLVFELDPNQEEAYQFIVPEFEVVNQGNFPLVITLKTFEQVTSVFNDVSPTKYADWSSLNKKQSKDLALALVPSKGEGWVSIKQEKCWVSDFVEGEIGVVKGESVVSFGFEAKHGVAFSEALNPQYRLTFIFELKK